MKTHPMDAPVHNKTLVEQKTDFTSEGSPPPGKVEGSVPPVTPDMAPTKRAKNRTPLNKDVSRRTTEKGASPPLPKGPTRPSKYG